MENAINILSLSLSNLASERKRVEVDLNSLSEEMYGKKEELNLLDARIMEISEAIKKLERGTNGSKSKKIKS